MRSLHTSLLSMLVIIAVLTAALFIWFTWAGNHAAPSTRSVHRPDTVASTDEPPLRLKHIGFDFDYYNSKTNSAGAIKFTPEGVYDNRLWTDFGHTDTATSKIHPQPIIRLPLKSNVYATVDGVVVDIPKMYSGDYSIHIATDKESRWRYELEHVTNVRVVVGDKVMAGQVIAEVSQDQNYPYGYLDIGILKGGNPPEHVCPFAYLDESIKRDTEQKILALYEAWETYKGDTTIYHEAAYHSPGCVVLGPVGE